MGITNGKLITLAQEHRFDVFVTVDKNLEHQQNLAGITFGLIVVAVPDNNIKYFRPICDDLRTAAEGIRPGQVIHVVGPAIGE